MCLGAILSLEILKPFLGWSQMRLLTKENSSPP